MALNVFIFANTNPQMYWPLKRRTKYIIHHFRKWKRKINYGSSSHNSVQVRINNLFYHLSCFTALTFVQLDIIYYDWRSKYYIYHWIWKWWSQTDISACSSLNSENIQFILEADILFQDQCFPDRYETSNKTYK